ncbi:MAG TPA: DUF4340 domain-containing protein [Rhodothermales bacterium]
MKRLLLLAAVLVVLIVIAWSAGMFGGPVSTMDLPDVAVDSDRVSRIDVSSGGEHIRVDRLDSGEWRLSSPVQADADTAAVMRFLRQIGDMQLESIVSSNPEGFSRFQVDSTGSEMTLEWGDRRLELIVGKMGPDFQSRYVRIDGDDRVMLANGVPSLSAKVDQWRDKTLWSMPVEAITSVSVTADDVTYGLSRTDGGWRLSSGAGDSAVDSVEVADFLDRVSTIKVDGFYTALTIDSVLANVTHQLRVEFAGGAAETLFMSKRQNDVAAFREGGADVLKLFTYNLTNLTTSFDGLAASTAEATESR